MILQARVPRGGSPCRTVAFAAPGGGRDRAGSPLVGVALLACGLVGLLPESAAFAPALKLSSGTVAASRSKAAIPFPVFSKGRRLRSERAASHSPPSSLSRPFMIRGGCERLGGSKCSQQMEQPGRSSCCVRDLHQLPLYHVAKSGEVGPMDP